MRSRFAIPAMVLTFLLGVGAVRVHTCITESRYPTFTASEANAMVGHRVRNVYWSTHYRGMKCPQGGGLCADVRVGEQGTVVATQKTSDGHFVVVLWDKSAGSPMFSYFGRKTRRVFLRIE